MKKAMLGLVVVVSLGCAGGPKAPVQAAPAPEAPAAETATETAPIDPAAHDEALEVFELLQRRIEGVAKDITPSVVYIEAIQKHQNRKNIVSGSGIIADAEGHIFTNEHVVESALKVTVTVPGIKEPLPATVIGADKQTDLAVLKVSPNGHGLKPARFGSSEKLVVGQWVLAVGNPFGFDNSVSFGIVQAKGRNLQFRGLINEFVQTDALIDQGSSGGPLVNLEGEVVGVNSIAAGRGIGFTIPIETALKVKKNLMESGQIERAWLGITFQPLTRQLSRYWGLGTQGGAIVSAVLDGSPAEKGGLKAGDIITEIEGEEVDVPDEGEASSLSRMVAGYPVGATIKVVVLRELKQRTLKVTLDAQPAIDSPERESDWGFGYQDITTGRQLNARLDSRVGVFVSFVERGTPADETMLEIGDIIVEVDGEKVRDAEALEKALDARASRDRVLLTAQRGKDIRFHLLERLGSEIVE